MLTKPQNLPAAALACCLSLLLVCCGAPYTPVATFEEMADPTADTLSDWSGVAAGLHASFVPADVRYPRSVTPDVNISGSQKLTGWRGERVAAQVLLWTAADLDGAQCGLGDFSSEGATLPASIASARFVRYVMTDEFGTGCAPRNKEDFASSLAADMLDSLPRFDLKARQVRPVWISVDIPADAAPGLYTCPVEMTARGAKAQKLTLELEVVPHLLPPPSQWTYHLDLWQHPTAVARVENLKVWSDAHFEACKPVMRMLADAGQKVITATLNKEPWNNQCYDAYADMILWTRGREGAWSYDYTVFDRWVQLMMDLGVNKMINCYSMLPWNNELHYTDAATGQVVEIKADPGTPLFTEMWTPFLKDFVVHLREKGWLGITNIAMDERSPETMAHIIKVMRSAAPELGIALADNHASYKKYPDVRDICVGINHQHADRADIEARRARGLVTTYYVCCSSAWPNTFTFSDPAEATYHAWLAVARDYDGFLRWAVQSWNEDPERDSRFRTWPAGDTYMIYPGARSSMRFELLRQGVQDAEKIRILRAEFAADASPEALGKLGTLEELVAPFAADTPVEGWKSSLHSARALLNEL